MILKMTEQTKTMLSIILDWSTTESMTPKFRLEQKPLMRRLLGSASLGDIGTHFPDTDARWKGVSSMKLLSMVGDLLGKYGYTVINIDATIIAQKPKLMPYIADMQRNISETLLIPQSDVSIKATTTENLGFCGRGEGIAAEAVCTIIKEYDTKVRPLKF